jgi:tRNA-(ms[2]io[6]A)-hydroxylase
VALRDLDAVLVDHAHCEVKAATTALSLALKNHGDLPMVVELTQLAQEELDHFARVVGFLEIRGLKLGLPPTDAYAAELHRAVARLPTSAQSQLVDRLLIAALIEARSCERFKLLIDAWPTGFDDALLAFYRELFECEARHYVKYRDLAFRIADAPASTVEVRLKRIAEVEAEIIVSKARPVTPTVHG